MLVLGVNNQGPTQLAASKLFQGLFQYSFKLEPMPLLAKNWSLSEDKKTYTFKLQENVKFHDGHPMTADDVIFSITKFHTELSPRAKPIFANIESTTAPDPLNGHADAEVAISQCRRALPPRIQRRPAPARWHWSPSC